MSSLEKRKELVQKLNDHPSDSSCLWTSVLYDWVDLGPQLCFANLFMYRNDGADDVVVAFHDMRSNFDKDYVEWVLNGHWCSEAFVTCTFEEMVKYGVRLNVDAPLEYALVGLSMLRLFSEPASLPISWYVDLGLSYEDAVIFACQYSFLDGDEFSQDWQYNSDHKPFRCVSDYKYYLGDYWFRSGYKLRGGLPSEDDEYPRLKESFYKSEDWYDEVRTRTCEKRGLTSKEAVKEYYRWKKESTECVD